MGFIEKRSGRYRARYRDPLGRQRSERFSCKADAERFIREMQVDIERGRWIDPAGADVALATWAEEFLSLARRLSPSTQETYARDLNRYVPPRFGSYRIGRLPADEIENWLNDEIAAGIAPSSVHRHYRVLRRELQVAVEKEKIPTNPCDRVQPPRVPKREMVFLTWEEAVDLAEAINERYRALIYLAVDSGMRCSELVGLRRAKVDLNRGKVRVTEQHIRLEAGEWLRKEPKTAAGVRSITISRETAAILAEHVERFTVPGLDSLVFPEPGRQPADLIELLAALLQAGARRCWSHLPVPRPQAHERRPGHRRGRPPEGHPGAHGPLLDQRDAGPLRPPVPGAGRGDRRWLRSTAGGGAAPAKRELTRAGVVDRSSSVYATPYG